ncbi:hypothetical protein [Paraburkholderia hospita]|uniref:hypothetical protein n=1 Tax=Paraburkholderia hospita TaxID=169430 RepID=UPI003F4F5B6A
MPVATTPMKLRHLLERYELTRKLFDEISIMLSADRGRHGRRCDDHRGIAAPPSTKDKNRGRDLEMHQTKKNQQWRFGMKAHIGDATQPLPVAPAGS